MLRHLPLLVVSVVSTLIHFIVCTPGLADVLVFDRAAKAVLRLDTATLAIKASATLPDVPARAVVSPDGTTLVVLCRGEGSESKEGFISKTRSLAVVLATDGLKEKARVELGWGLGPALWDSEGKTLVVLAPGFPSSSEKKNLPATVVSIDREGKTHRVSLVRAGSDMVISPDGSVAAVLAPRPDYNTLLWFCDLTNETAGDPVGVRDAPRELLLAPDGVTLYALFRGVTEGKPDRPGSLTVFSFAERRRTAEIPIGTVGAVGGFGKGGRLILGCSRAGDAKDDFITVVKGPAIEYSAPGPKSPAAFHFAPDGRTAWLVGGTSAFVDFGDFSSAPVVRASKLRSALGSFEVTPDGKLALVRCPVPDAWATVYVYDLPEGKKRESIDLASFGSRLALASVGIAGTMISADVGRRDALTYSRPTYTDTAWEPRPKRPRGKPIVIRPDGKVAFVYDPLGGDVVQIDLEKMEKGKRQGIGKGSRGFYLTGGGRTLLIAAEDGLYVIDAATFDKPVAIGTDGPADLAIGPAAETLLLAKGLLAVVDPATGRVTERIGSLQDPVVAAFLP